MKDGIEKEPTEHEITVNKILGFVIAVFGIIGVYSLIWANWKGLQLCATFVVTAALLVLFIPEDW